ncbi:MAG: DUF3040 domain-containing protein [Acidimicrobiaceae bacterium]|nr:DUF3040 domain-containing protein [Acidimicrobiaceae bacterium]
MSPHDEAMLSPAERAALAGLESKAEADDPRLAAALRGGIRRSFPTLRVPPALIHSALVRSAGGWIGPLLVVVGLAVMIVALSSLTILAAFGAVAFMIGAVLSAGLVRRGVTAGFRSLPGQEKRRGDEGSAAAG